MCLPVRLNTLRLTMLLDTSLGIDLSHASNVASAFSSLARHLRAQEPYLVLSQSMGDHTVDPADTRL